MSPIRFFVCLEILLRKIPERVSDAPIKFRGAKFYGPIAQLAEHRADNAGVTGAIPVRPINFHARWRVKVNPERRRDQRGGARDHILAKDHNRFAL